MKIRFSKIIQNTTLVCLVLLLQLFALPIHAEGEDEQPDIHKKQAVFDSNFEQEIPLTSIKVLDFDEDDTGIVGEWFIRLPKYFSPWSQNEWNLQIGNGTAAIYSGNGQPSTINGALPDEGRRSPALMQNVKLLPNTNYKMHVVMDEIYADSSYLVINGDSFDMKYNGDDYRGIYPDGVLIEKDVTSDENGIVTVEIYLQHRRDEWIYTSRTIAFELTKVSIFKEQKVTRYVELDHEDHELKDMVVGDEFAPELERLEKDGIVYLLENVVEEGLDRTCYYVEQKTTKFVELGNETNVLKEAVVGKSFVEKEDKLEKDGITYLYAEMREDERERTYYYMPEKTTKYVEFGNVDHVLKPEVKGKDFANKEDTITEGEYTYDFVSESFSENQLVKTYAYQKRLYTTKFVELGNETNVLKEEVVGTKFADVEQVIDKDGKTYKFVKSRKDGFEMTYLYQMNVSPLSHEKTPKETVVVANHMPATGDSMLSTTVSFVLAIIVAIMVRE